jgi:hypothetical protein
MSERYNGWANRETWLVNVWFNPESREDVEAARYTLEEAVGNLPAFLVDFVSTDLVDWEELLSHFEEEEVEEE